MKKKIVAMGVLAAVAAVFMASPAQAQMGRTWPSEKKIVPDPVTGLPLTLLTSTDNPGVTQSKIYQTHRQWTSDGKWLIFRGSRDGSGSQAFAVNEESGLIVQVTETGFTGMLCAGNKTMKLYVLAGGGGPGGAGGRRGPATATAPPPPKSSTRPRTSTPSYSRCSGCSKRRGRGRLTADERG